MKVFTKDELAKNDGKEGRPAYVAYMGKVYDMTGTLESEHGDHYGHNFGVNLTDEMDDAPHSDALVFERPVVGIYEE
ncbi:MAG: cytochrome b5 domain-containing protein [bacterium]